MRSSAGHEVEYCEQPSVLGDDTFRLRTPFEDFLVRIDRFAGRPSAEQQALARSAMSALRFGVEARDPGIVATAQKMLVALDGGGSFGLFGLHELGPSLTDAAFETQLLRRLDEEFERGRLVVEREQIASLTDRREPFEFELPPLPRARPSRTFAYDVKVIDDTGAAVAGIDINITVDGEPETIKTNGGGNVHSEGSSGSSAPLKMFDVESVPAKLATRWNRPPAKDLPKGSDVGAVPVGNKFVFSVSANRLFTLILQRPAVRRVRLIGMLFDANKCFLLPQALPGILDIVATQRTRPAAKVLVVGHAGGDEDLAGADIAVDRADMISAYLTNQPEQWLAWFKKDKPERSRWGTREAQLMLSALPAGGAPFYEGTASGVTDVTTRAAIRAFQKSQGLAADGKASNATLKALVQAYLNIEGTSLAKGIVPVTHGCEGHFEDMPTSEGFDPDDRRVDVFFFDWEIKPAPPGKTSAVGSAEYPAWCAGLVETRDFEHHGIHVQIIDMKKRPVPLAEVAIKGPTSGTATADKHGFVSFFGLKPGDYTLTAQKDGKRVGTYKITYPTAKTVPGYAKPKSKKKPAAASGGEPSGGEPSGGLP